MLLQLSLRSRGALAVALGAAIWGLFWIPIQHLDDRGIHGLWAVALTMLTTSLVAIPVMFWRGRLERHQVKSIIFVGSGIGAAAVFYFAAIVFGDVIRVIFLFYLLPMWATLSAWLLYQQPISFLQLSAIGLALFGLYLLLGDGGNLPLPHDLSDVFAIIAGLLWGLCLTLIRGHSDLNPYANSAAPFVLGTPIALLVGGLLFAINPGLSPPVPTWQTIVAVLPVTLLFSAVLLWPSMFLQVWGARLIPSPTASLLTMTEIVVATGSAWLLTDTNMTLIGVLGGLLIILAAVLDIKSRTD